MRPGIDGPTPGRTRELRIILEINIHDWLRKRTRMNVDRHVQCLGALKDRPERFFIEVMTLRVSIDECASESEVLHSSFEFVGGCHGVLRGQRRESEESRGILFHN